MIHRISMCKCDLIKFSNLFYDKIKFTLKKKFKRKFQTRYKKNYSYKFFTPFEIPMKNFI